MLNDGHKFFVLLMYSHNFFWNVTEQQMNFIINSHMNWEVHFRWVLFVFYVSILTKSTWCNQFLYILCAIMPSMSIRFESISYVHFCITTMKWSRLIRRFSSMCPQQSKWKIHWISFSSWKKNFQFTFDFQFLDSWQIL